MAGVLLAANLGAWAWALIAFRDFPLLLGTAFLAYSFGLRHAVDADHIAAIDNVTRKLMAERMPAESVGFFFSLGHSTVVLAASILLAAGTILFRDQIEAVHEIGSLIGTTVSAGFLLLIAAINAAVLGGVVRTFRRVKAGGSYREDELGVLLGRGLLARLVRPLFRLVSRSWHMYPLGLLFGLGFDTATEVGLLGISATQASAGLPIWSILVFPALFTAGMSLVDTIDNLLMVGAYGWAFVRPLRKLYYNIVITSVSLLVALLVGGLEILGLIADRFALEGGFWSALGTVNENFGLVGYAIVAIIAATWAAAMLIYRWKGYDRLESRA